MLIVCNGMIRSGSTLQYNLVRNILENSKLGRGEGFYDSKNCVLSKYQINQWADDDYYHVIKTHELHPEIVQLSKSNKANLLKICYIYRDIRDVAASVKNKWGREGEELIASLDRAVNTYYEIMKIQNVFIQRYEDVFNNTSRNVEEISNFLNIFIEKKVFNRIVDEYSIQNVKKQTKSFKLILLKKLLMFFRIITPVKARKIFRPIISNMTGFKGSNVFNKKTQFHPDHISKNKGAIGSWRTDLNNYEKKIITERYRSWLIERGYIIEKRE